jgi:hypothetical protein
MQSWKNTVGYEQTEGHQVESEGGERLYKKG